MRPIGQEIPTNAFELISVVHFGYLILMRDQIVVEHMRGAMVQATAVRQQIDLSVVRVAPLTKLRQSGKISIFFPLNVKALKIMHHIGEPLHRADLHIHRGSSIHSVKILFHKQ